MAKRVIRRDSKGNIISTKPAAKAAPTKQSVLKELAKVISGKASAKIISGKDKALLAKFDPVKLTNKLTKLGALEGFTDAQMGDFQKLFAGFAGSNKKVNAKEAGKLAKFAAGAGQDNQLAGIETEVDSIVPEPGKIQTPVGDAGIVSPERGRLATLNMSIFARAAVSRARGVRAATATTPRGDAGYARSLARISLGGGFV